MPSYVILGASRGIGFQFLRTLAQDSNNIVIGTARKVADTEAKVKAENLSNVTILQADLTDPASLYRAASEISSITGGAVDHLVINGAYLNWESLAPARNDFVGKEDWFLDELNKAIHANTAGVLFAANAFLPLVKKSSIKKVIVISTGHAATDAIERADIDNAIPYALSKVAANMLISKFAVESKKNGDGVIFLALSPGVVYTVHDGPIEEAPKEVQEMFKAMTTQFQKVEPSYKGPNTPAESVEAMLKVIDGLTEKDNGAFMSHHGDQNWL